MILHNSKEQLEKWKIDIDNILKERLKIELHPSKSHVLELHKGINFLGFRVFFYNRLVRKSNLKNFERKFNNIKILFDEGLLTREESLESLEGWLTYCFHANTYKYRKYLIRSFNNLFPHKPNTQIHNKKKYNNFFIKSRASELQFSVQKTLLLYKQGFKIKEIAEKSFIKESTVWGHLANLIEHKQLSVWKVLTEEKVYKIIRKIYSRKERLRDIKKRLNDVSITYDEIACVMASIKSRRKWRK